MTWDWQEITALFIVGCAFAYVGRLIYQRLRRRQAGACGGGCFGCHLAEPESSQIVEIGISDNLSVRPGEPR